VPEDRGPLDYSQKGTNGGPPMRATFCLLLLLAACNSSSSTPSGDPAPDFQLQDVNTTSATFNQSVSPRDYLAMTSGFYFGAAT